MITDNILLEDYYLAQSFSERLPPADHGNRYRDSQPNIRLSSGNSSEGKEGLYESEWSTTPEQDPHNQ